MSLTEYALKDAYVYYHEGVESRPEWAYKDAMAIVENKWANLLKGMPNTSNVGVGLVNYNDLGGSITRSGTWRNVVVTGAGSKTKNEWNKKSWKCWFTINYEMFLQYIPSGLNPTPVSGGLDNEEVLRKIAEAKLE